MRILFLTGRLPYPPNRGDRLRAYHFLRVLSREHRLTLLSFIGDEAESGHVAALRPFCEDVQLIHRSPLASRASAALNAWRPLPLQSLYYRSAVMQAAVDRLLTRKRFDAVYVHLFRMAQFVDRRSVPFRILDLTDAISGEVGRSLPYRDPLWRIIYRVELPRIRRYEREVAARFEETWVISEAERGAVVDGLAEEAAARVQVVRNGVEPDRYRPYRATATGTTVAFTGHLGVFHNVDAAERLARGILPRVREQVPGARLDLIGAEPAPRVRALATEPGVRLVGPVIDLNAALNEAAIFAAPLRFAAGVQNKVLEAMAAGLPVVTTAEVNAGLGATDGEHLQLAGDDDDFAAAIVALLRDPAARGQLGRAGRDFVLRRYRWDEVLERARAISALVE